MKVPRQREPHPEQAVYGISIAAHMSGMDPQSLRLYERRGLLEPARTAGGTRLYSLLDIERLHRIGDLLAAGLNIAGIRMVLGLEHTNKRMAADNERLTRENERLSGADKPARSTGHSGHSR